MELRRSWERGMQNSKRASVRDESYQIDFINSDGQAVTCPKRWSRRWLEGLSIPDLRRLQVTLLNTNTDWGPFNPDTYWARNLLVYNVIEYKISKL